MDIQKLNDQMKSVKTFEEYNADLQQAFCEKHSELEQPHPEYTNDVCHSCAKEELLREQSTNVLLNPKQLELWKYLYSTLSTSQIERVLDSAGLTWADWREFCEVMRSE